MRTHLVRPIPSCEHQHFTITGAPLAFQELYDRLSRLGPASTESQEVVIFHRDYRMLPDELGRSVPQYLIVRYMFEGVGTLHKEMVEQVQAVDEVWVPSQFHKQVFVDNGVPQTKVHVVPEATW